MIGLCYWDIGILGSSEGSSCIVVRKMERKSGMSRAAKKRKLKKQKLREEDAVMEDEDEEVHDIPTAAASSACDIDTCATKSTIPLVPLDNVLHNTFLDVPSRAQCLMVHLLAPVNREEFYQTIWEHQPHVVSREDTEIYASIYNSGLVQKLLNDHVMKFPSDYSLRKTDGTSSTTLDVTKAQRIDEGEYLLKPKDIWRRVREGYCLRLQHPQKFDDTLWQYLSLLEHEFGDIIESRVTLMSAGCNGWGLERAEGHVLLLHTEGQGHYRIYAPPSSSPVSMSEDEDAQLLNIDPSTLGSPVVNTTVSAGGLVYVPKGYVIECNACRGADKCAFISIITGTDYTCRGLLDLTLPQALEAATLRHASLQSLLPRTFLQFMGVARCENDDDIRRKRFFSHARGLLETVASSAMEMMDAAADQLAKRFISGRLPVPMTEEEEANSGQGCNADSSVFPYTKLRMLRPGIARAIVEDGVVVVYHCMDNAR